MGQKIEIDWNTKVERPKELVYEEGLVITAGLVRQGDHEVAKQVVEVLVTNFPEKVLNRRDKKLNGGDK